MCVDPNAKSQTELLAAILQAALIKGRAGTGIFGLRQQRPSFDYLCQQLALLHPQATTDADRIERAFGRTQFIHLTRADKLAQAVSLLKAKQTGLWHIATDGSEWERTAQPQAPCYDRNAIGACVDMLKAYDAGWAEWFKREGIEPIYVGYDELSADPNATLKHVLNALGLDSRAAEGIDLEVKKMADDTNSDWIARFRREMSST